MRFQVPQFIETETKIVGPFTLKQFLIYVAAVLCLIPVYISSDLSLFITIALPVLGLAAAFAHIKIGSKSLAQTVANAASHTLHGQFYMWRRLPHARGALLAQALQKLSPTSLIPINPTPWKNTVSCV